MALNDYAKSLDIDKIKNKSLDDALKLIKTSLKENKKFEDKNSLIVGFSFLEENKNIEFEDNVKAVINENFNDFKIVYIQGDKGDHEEAKKVGISLGKYSINKRLNNRFSEEQMKNITIDELIDRLNEENINLRDDEEDYDVNDEKDHDNKIDSDNEIEQDDEVEDDKTDDKENDKDDNDNKEKEQDKNSKSVNSDLNDDDTYEDDKYENDNDEDENDEDHNKQEIRDDKDSSDNLNDSDDD